LSGQSRQRINRRPETEPPIHGFRGLIVAVVESARYARDMIGANYDVVVKIDEDFLPAERKS